MASDTIGGSSLQILRSKICAAGFQAQLLLYCWLTNPENMSYFICMLDDSCCFINVPSMMGYIKQKIHTFMSKVCNHFLQQADCSISVARSDEEYCGDIGLAAACCGKQMGWPCGKGQVVTWGCHGKQEHKQNWDCNDGSIYVVLALPIHQALYTDKL